jgi:hypothetical protein
LINFEDGDELGLDHTVPRNSDDGQHIPDEVRGFRELVFLFEEFQNYLRV